MAVVAVPGRIADALCRFMLCALAAALLLTSFTGRAGVQVLDRDHAARLFPLHLHGVAGEQDYVEHHQAPAPFVAGHCHAPYEQDDPPPTRQDVQAASALAGSVLCVSTAVHPIAPPAIELAARTDATRMGSIALTPLVPPPQF